jgi:hypothetical protein
MADQIPNQTERPQSQVANVLRFLAILVVAVGGGALASLAGEEEDLAPLLLAGTQLLVGAAVLFAFAYMCEALNDIRDNTRPSRTKK